MKRLLREPLFHFLLIGAALFGLYELANPGPSDAERRIVVSAGRIDQLAGIFARTWQRPPEPEELKALIDEYVIEEVYYRKALEMGIDRDDTVIRRRLRQKVEFLTDDAAALAEPTDDDLARYFAANEERFRTEPTYTFRQIYFNPERHGSDPGAHLKQQLARLRSGADVPGDGGLLPGSFTDAPRREVDGAFGAGFAAGLDELTPAVWSGPLSSGLGLHLVLVESCNPGRLPELAAVRDAVAREWANERRLEIRRGFNERLLEGYDVVIEWPGPVASPGAGEPELP